jgi:TonB family protein
LSFCGSVYPQTASEYEVKAAYLYNFAKLAQWPPEAMPSSTSPSVLCVFGGNDEFTRVMRTTLSGKSIGSHNVSVLVTDDTSSCNLIFFRNSERNRTLRALAALTGKSVLLVGEDEAFLGSGGMINLLLKDGKVRFQVNAAALEQAHIQYDPSFLSMAYAESGGGTQSAGVRALRSSSTPEYPDLARRLNLAGAVQLQVVVRADGTVKDVKVIGGHPLLTDAAVKAVWEWKFRPGRSETVEKVKVSFGQ